MSIENVIEEKIKKKNFKSYQLHPIVLFLHIKFIILVVFSFAMYLFVYHLLKNTFFADGILVVFFIFQVILIYSYFQKKSAINFENKEIQEILKIIICEDYIIVPMFLFKQFGDHSNSFTFKRIKIVKCAEKIFKPTDFYFYNDNGASNPITTDWLFKFFYPIGLMSQPIYFKFKIANEFHKGFVLINSLTFTSKLDGEENFESFYELYLKIKEWCLERELNPRPRGYESRALTS